MRKLWYKFSLVLVINRICITYNIFVSPMIYVTLLIQQPVVRCHLMPFVLRRAIRRDGIAIGWLVCVHLRDLLCTGLQVRSSGILAKITTGTDVKIADLKIRTDSLSHNKFMTLLESRIEIGLFYEDGMRNLQSSKEFDLQGQLDHVILKCCLVNLTKNLTEHFFLFLMDDFLELARNQSG